SDQPGVVKSLGSQSSPLAEPPPLAAPPLPEFPEPPAPVPPPPEPPSAVEPPEASSSPPPSPQARVREREKKQINERGEVIEFLLWVTQEAKRHQSISKNCNLTRVAPRQLTPRATVRKPSNALHPGSLGRKKRLL